MVSRVDHQLMGPPACKFLSDTSIPARFARIPLYIGMLGIGLNVLFFVYTSTLAWGFRRFNEKWEISSTSALPFLTLLGLISFCL